VITCIPLSALPDSFGTCIRARTSYVCACGCGVRVCVHVRTCVEYAYLNIVTAWYFALLLALKMFAQTSTFVQSVAVSLSIRVCV